jgi:phage terminase large subunit
VACLNDVVDATISCTKADPRFAYVAPYYAQAKDVAWTYLKRYTMDIPGAEPNEGELRVDFHHNGGRIRLYGADNYNRMRGIYLDGCVLDEAADFDPRAWPEVIRPALSDRMGWATFIGTPKGRNDFYEIMEMAKADPDNWFHLILRASETGIIPEGELADARRMMTPEQFEQEFECSFDAAILGAYYGKDLADAEREGRICDVEPDPVLVTHTAWDLGKNDSTSIFFFQVAPNGIRVIDYYENQNFDLDHYAAIIRDKPYKYGTHYLPHDARAKLLGMQRTRIEQLIDLLKGHSFRIVMDHTVMDGINAARLTLKSTWFDAKNCKFALEALRQYRTEFDERAKVFRSNPKHDWTSHCADAFRYLAMAWKEMRPEAPKIVQPKSLSYSATPDGAIRSNMSINDIIRRMERQRKAKR